MSHPAALALMKRREALLAQIALERAALAHHGAAVRRLALLVDKIGNVFRFVKSHPGALLLPVAITILARPRRLLTMAASGFGLLRVVRNWRRRVQ